MLEIGNCFGQSMNYLGCLCYNLCNKLCLSVVGPEMAMDFGFTKWNRCLVRGPQTTHCMDVGLLKIVLVCLLDRKWSMYVLIKIFLNMNGLECVWKEIVNA